MIRKLKAKVTEWLIRDVKPLAEHAEEQRCDADKKHRAALEKLQAADEQAQKLRAMDRRNHYTESLMESYTPKGRTT